jgi:lysophospholipase L1-like esterase
MLGTNNTGHSGIVQAEHQSRVYNSSPRDTTDGLHQIIESLLKEMPSTQILLISILPRGESPTCFARIQNQATNTIIKTFANQKNIHWIDTQDLFLNSEGSVNRDDMPDLLHLSSSAYEKWAQRLIPKIKELLKP